MSEPKTLGLDTLAPAGPGEQLQALWVPYPRVHFLVNRSQVRVSLYASEVVRVNTRHSYFYELILVEDEILLFLDLHKFLIQTFGLEETTRAQLAVISACEDLSAQTQAYLGKVIFPKLAAFEVSVQRIGFRLPSNTSMQTLVAGDFEPHPGALATVLPKRGLIATHPTEDSMGFLLDLDYLLRPNLLFARSPAEGSRP